MRTGMFRRLRRILFHTAAAASAVMLLATLALWPLSYFRYDRLAYRGPDGGTSIFSLEGRFGASNGNYPYTRGEFNYGKFDLDAARAWESWSYTTSGEEATPGFRMQWFLGCWYVTTTPGNTFYPAHIIHIPYSYLALLSAIMPTIWLVTRKRRRRKDRLAKGLCLKCGYDLRAHQPGDNCPECGTVVKRAAGAKA